MPRCCRDNILTMVSEWPQSVDHGVVDELLRGRGSEPSPDFHVNMSYGYEAQPWWREHRDEFRHRPTRS